MLCVIPNFSRDGAEKWNWVTFNTFRMGRIFKSAAIMLMVAAGLAGGTYSFFADTEQSVGNTFTAGAIDLRVDHSKQVYNGVDCKTCSVSIVSNTDNRVIKKDGISIVPYSAFLSPVAGDWTTLAGANWIWGAEGLASGDDRTEYTFENTFTWFGPVVGATLDLSLTGDDNYKVYVNDQLVGQDLTGAVWQDVDTYTSFESAIVQGENKITFVVKNSEGFWAGLLYKLTINGNCGDEYFRTHCRLWDEKDLGVGDVFFNFDDVKPGDRGTNVISLHVDSNDAWACMSTANEQDLENVANETELVIPDTTTGVGPTDGELSPFLKVFLWWDTDGDGTYDLGEDSIATTDFGTLGTVALADSTTGSGPIAGGTTQNLGLFWCAGTLAPPVAGNVFVCDGQSMGNIAQTDRYITDLVFSAIQQRNNTDYTCSIEEENVVREDV